MALPLGMPPVSVLTGSGVMSAIGSAGAASSLASFAAPFAIVGGLASMFGAMQQNKAVDQAARKQKLIEQFKAADQKAAIARQTARNEGAITASSADRNAFGRSAKAAALNQVAKGLTSQSIVEQQKALNILSIGQQAAANKQSALQSFAGGAVSGLSLGMTLRGFNA